MMPITDFFKKIDKSSSQLTSPKKTLAPSDTNPATPAAPNTMDQKLKRSAKSLVKSKPKPAPSGATVDLTETSPKRKSPARKATSPAKVAKSPAKLTPSSPRVSSSVKASPAKSAAVTPKKAPARKRIAPVDEDDEDFVLEEKKEEATPAIETAKPSDEKKFNYREYLLKKSAVPAALGSKEIPEGAPNCFEGLAFLFTGDLSSITRDQATDLVKRYAGRIVSAPSKKTNFVVVGEAPGPVKMEKIRALGLTQIDEDAFLDMIRKSNPSGGQKTADNQEDFPQVVSPARKSASVAKAKPAKTIKSNDEADLWTVKYMPQSHDELIGNPGIYEKLTEWLTTWNRETSENKAALLSGPPGIGKTTMANLLCKELGLDCIEMNASDTRSKKTLHETVREITDATSLSSMFTGQHRVTKNHILIMDEVDGMSSGDRGGMAELIQLIKKTRIPIICICNDRASPKVRSLANHCLDLRLRRTDARQIVPRIKAIAEKEGLTIQANALEELVASTHSDIRQILNLLSTFKLTRENLSYDAGKSLSIGNAKDIEQGPFDATGNLLGGGQWNRMSLNEKIDQYFIDGSLVPLMIHENYLKCRANSSREIVSTRNTKPNFMELCAAAADSLSISDRVDSLIRGSNQEWSLAPLHGMMSSVLPAYYVHGQMGGRIDFAGWLGQNSRTMKNQRLLTELTHHTFLHTMAGKLELRMDYIRSFASSIVAPMRDTGVEGIDRTIAFMDDYSISRDDVDNVLDMVLDPSLNTAAFAKIPTTVRSTFTRKYNQGVHRLPYSLSGGATSVKRISSDVSGGAGEDEEDDAIFASASPDDNEQEAGDDDLTKDKMIKSKPVKGKKAATGAPASKKQKK